MIHGADVIHGYRTQFPIPLGQAAAWNPKLSEQAARIAALEASGAGIDWVFAPMVDVSERTLREVYLPRSKAASTPARPR